MSTTLHVLGSQSICSIHRDGSHCKSVADTLLRASTLGYPSWWGPLSHCFQSLFGNVSESSRLESPSSLCLAIFCHVHTFNSSLCLLVNKVTMFQNQNVPSSPNICFVTHTTNCKEIFLRCVAWPLCLKPGGLSITTKFSVIHKCSKGLSKTHPCMHEAFSRFELLTHCIRPSNCSLWLSQLPRQFCKAQMRIVNVPSCNGQNCSNIRTICRFSCDGP